MNYQGLFYLASGFSSFLVLFLILRTIGQNLQLKESVKEVGETLSLAWNGIEPLLIKDIIVESHDVKTFRLARKDNAEFPNFYAGQFLSFKIDNKNARSYSISSSSLNSHLIDVSIKKLDGGIGSSHFHSLNIGDKVEAYKPNGLFSDELLEQKSSRVYIGGGIGITPLISMIKSALDKSDQSDISLFYGARTLEDLIFHDQLLLLSKRYANFTYVPVLSDQKDNWDGERGFISSDLIKTTISDIHENNYYFCGPPIMTDTISEQLVESGVDKKKIHSEKFVSPTTISEDEIKHVDAKIEIDDRELDYSGKQLLLEFFEDNDISIPFACRSGVCGECKVKCKSGSVLSMTDSGLTPEEVEDGYILSCVSWPKEDSSFSS